MPSPRAPCWRIALIQTENLIIIEQTFSARKTLDPQHAELFHIGLDVWTTGFGHSQPRASEGLTVVGWRFMIPRLPAGGTLFTSEMSHRIKVPDSRSTFGLKKALASLVRMTFTTEPSAMCEPVCFALGPRRGGSSIAKSTKVPTPKRWRATRTKLGLGAMDHPRSP